MTDVANLRRRSFNPEETISAYLGDKSYDEWLISYDSLIKDARDEIEALTESSEGFDENKRVLVMAGAISGMFFLVLMLFFLPTPIAVLTGNVVGVAENGGAPFSVYAASLFLSAFVGVVSFVMLKND